MSNSKKWYQQPAVAAAMVAGVFGVIVAVVQVAGPGLWASNEDPGRVADPVPPAVPVPQAQVLEGWTVLATYRNGELETPYVTFYSQRPAVQTVYETEHASILWSVFPDRDDMAQQE